MTCPNVNHSEFKRLCRSSPFWRKKADQVIVIHKAHLVWWYLAWKVDLTSGIDMNIVSAGVCERSKRQ